ncbi:hypothetical protein FGO68_gene9853 [Halteria grandinella]|uniref:Uncharacterized protein n=1 Tax=Halteria grandinella TaxID=5974 RepID=A0A8J8NUJ5_HALGN|nr:hypothetical protein FGO68_gene9853 [Halteria grandinella]
MNKFSTDFCLFNLNKLICNKNFDFPIFQEYIHAKELMLKQKCQVLSLSLLSKFSIAETIFIQFGQYLKIIKSDPKCFCPKNIILECNHKKVQWIGLMAEILDGFCDHENTQQLFLSNTCCIQSFSPPPLEKLYATVKQFKNLRQLTIPFGCTQEDIDNITSMLKDLRHLKHLTLNSTDKNTNQRECLAVQKISEFAIRRMIELRTIHFVVTNKLSLNEVPFSERALPLTIQIVVYGLQTQYKIDTRTGQERFKHKCSKR